MPIKNIIFDFGGVLLDLAPERCKTAFHQLNFTEIDEMLTLTHQKGVLDKMERGLCRREDFCREVRQYIARHCAEQGSDGANTPLPTDEALLRAWTTMADGIPAYRLRFIDELKEKGYHVSALSNTNEVHWNFCRPLFIEAGYHPEVLFEHLWLSYQMHLVKPEPEIFARLLEESGYVPEETLFVDDSDTNCRVANTFGIRTYQAPIRADWRAELTQVLASLS
jgi:putative hydrolase of the HAD superfamily